MNYSGHKLIGETPGLTANRVTEFDRVHRGPLTQDRYHCWLLRTCGYSNLTGPQLVLSSRNCNQATESKCIIHVQVNVVLVMICTSATTKYVYELENWQGIRQAMIVCRAGCQSMLMGQKSGRTALQGVRNICNSSILLFLVKSFWLNPISFIFLLFSTR